ncbi:hypothetical protein EJV47_18260 [Hymenobacter gummosus]|uniref:Uncharacterized protein n=1 Tax=Hymenobacter gummosus TaxID=1776032 RepID=A0A3S0H7Q4_9BACT|nr:hypothetical protein [Hymenobacter gummosus]RTQ47863.1 hypothetical protein EJV47_18260 [Hymenobacter gummosus]
MSPEEYKWQVEWVQSQYPALKLTFAQAEAVFQFEQERDFDSADDFSHWEKLDFEYDTFQRILTPEQLRRYQALHEANVQAWLQQLAQFDAAAAENIPERQRHLAYCRDELIPALYREPLLLPFGSLNEPAKQAFVVAEYERFLRAGKKRALIEHYRQHRQFAPRILQEQLLHFELLALMPDYAEFIEAADAPTRAVVQFLFEELRSDIGYRYDDILSRYEDALVARSRTEFEAQHGILPEQVQGYVIHTKYSRDDHLNQWTLALLWLGRHPADYLRLRWPEVYGK